MYIFQYIQLIMWQIDSRDDRGSYWNKGKNELILSGKLIDKQKYMDFLFEFGNQMKIFTCNFSRTAKLSTTTRPVSFY